MVEGMTTIGIIGAGNLGSQVARLAVANGYEVVIATSRGPKSWNIRLQDFSKVRSRNGARVRLRVSPLLGYVSRIEVLDAPTPTEHTGFDQYAHRR